MPHPPHAAPPPVFPRPGPFHVLLLRHGQTDANATGVLQGWRPTPLNELGRRQALLLAGRVAAFEPRVQRLVSSDLTRAVQTAEPVAAAAGLELVTSAEWRERGGGLLEGKAIGERETWRTTAGDVEAPGAEPAAAFRTRVRRALEGLPGLFPGASVVAVVTHGGPIRTVLRLLADGEVPLAAGQGPVEAATIPNCSVLHLVRDEAPGGGGVAAWRVSCLNDVAHLDAAGVSGRDSG